VKCEDDCGWPTGHTNPCGRRHVPGSPCQFCSKPTPLDGGACPDCWISLEGMPIADIKGLLALGDLSLTHEQE
jgi:hypothetical protein